MSFDSTFIQDIEHPDDPTLQQALSEACNSTREKLQQMGFTSPEEWLVRKVAFAYFFDWKADSPDYALVLPDPGNIGKQQQNEIRHLQSTGPDISYEDQVDFYRSVAKKWYLNHPTDFPEEFLSLARTHGLIQYADDWQTYIRSDDFFDDFYMTDVLKYRVDGYPTDGGWESSAFYRQLKRELVELDPNVIFVFGGSAWHTIRKYLHPNPVNPPVSDETSIMETHGEIYCTDTDIDAFIIPLGHMSGQVWWRFPPEEYIDQLETALTELRNLTTDDFQLPDGFCETEDDSVENLSSLDEIAQGIGEVNEFDT